MAKRYVMVCGVLVCTLSLALISGCRAFSSTYESPEADLVANPPKNPTDAAANKPLSKPAATPSETLPPPIDFSKDTTECKTPEGVTVGHNPTPLFSNFGWVVPVDGEQVSVSAVKKGSYSATITIQKDLSNQSSNVLSFVVKQTATDAFSVCNFSYTEGKDHVYMGVSGTVMIDRVNAVDQKEKIIVNSGTFDLNVTRMPNAKTATKVQAIYLGAAIPSESTVVGMPLSGIYFTDVLPDTLSK